MITRRAFLKWLAALALRPRWLPPRPAPGAPGMAIPLVIPWHVGESRPYRRYFSAVLWGWVKR